VSEIEGLKLLRRIEEGVAGKTGDAFFRQIIADLARALNAHAAFCSRLLPGRRAAMLSFWVDGVYQPCLEYVLAGTPCEFVYNGQIMAFARSIGDIFPVDREWFASLGVNSYLGIPVKSEGEQVLGHLAVMDTRERDWREADVDVLRLFSLRFAAELERARYERELESFNAILEQTNQRLTEEVAQRRAAEAALASAKQAAEAANQAKSIFLTQMSHELRTPLNGLLGYTQLMERDHALLASQRTNLVAMRRCGEHLLTLINDVLDLARIEAGSMTLDATSFDLRELLGGVADMIRVRADEAAIAFRIELEGSLPAIVHADARRVRQVLLNLLGNAVKFTAGGAVVFTVAASDWGDGKVHLRFTVSDNGSGIPPAELERIFEPFHQVPTPRQPGEGTGLGLAITRAIVRALGGSISVASEMGRGTRFVVDIEVGVPVAVTLKPPARIERIHGYLGPRRRVLIADDEPLNRDVLRQLLEPLGFEILDCENGAEALQLAADSSPDLILIDLVMPIKDGLTTVRELRADPSLARIPVVALSASAFAETDAECREAGCNAFLAKPVRFEALLDVVKRCLDVEWVAAGVARTAVSSVDRPAEPQVTAIATLPAEKAQRLLDCARRGDITALGAEIESLQCADQNLQNFAARLQALADEFDMKAIRKLLGAAAAD